MARLSTKKTVSIILGSLLVLSLFAFKAVDFRTSKSLDIFFSFYRELSIFYVDRIDPEKLIKTGIDAMLESLDPYNEYVTEENSETLQFQTTGEYGGMGALIRRQKTHPIIAEVYEGTPAHRAGLMAGDVILSVNSVSVEQANVELVSSMLKGAPNTNLTVCIARNNIADTLTFTFKRDKIHIPSVSFYGTISEGVGYIKMANFTTDSHKEVERALNDLLKQHNAQSIVLDLRGNPGGLLNEAVRVVNLFVDKNQLVVYTKGQIKQFDQEYKTTSQPVNTTIPLVVMVDRASASASEIVAGALQDMDRAVVVGERTFGKGLVQTTRPLPYNGQLKITTAKYYIPSGRCIQALDYSNMNEDGSVGAIPDSLISAFTTLNGRVVYDGGGILPDTIHEHTPFNRITTMLYARQLLFDFATKYRFSNDTIQAPTSFALSNQEYKDFMKFIIDKDFEFQSNTEYYLNEMISSAKQENYYLIAGNLIDSLQSVIIANRFKDLEFSGPQIRRLLEEEITSRYYYQRGRAQFQALNDTGVALAISILSNSLLYQSILSPLAQE
jgi:carboxyl-terminal processing protease